MTNRGKTSFAFTFVLFFALAIRGGAAELATEEVVARCIDALGGYANWRAIETLELSGDHSSYSYVRPFRMWHKYPDLYRFDSSEGRRTLVVGYDGRTAWWQTEITLVSGANWPVETPRSHAREITADADLLIGPLGFQEEGKVFEFLGEAELDKEKYFLLKVTRQDKSIEHWYLDMDRFLPTVRISKGAELGQITERRTYFAEYRTVTGGVVLPHFIEIEVGNDYRTLEIQEHRVNVNIDSRMFSLPLPAGMEGLQLLAGRWKISVKIRKAPNAPWGISEAVATISKDFHGSLIEEEISYDAGEFPWKVRRLFTYDRFQDVFRIGHFDNFTSHLDILEGAMEDGRLIVSNLKSGTPWEVYDRTYHTREIIHDIREDSFTRDRQTSTDGGKSWITTAIFSYTRMRENE